MKQIIDFLKNDWFRISLLVIIVAMFSITFYWFGWRPSEIRKECYLLLQIGGGFVEGQREDDLPSLKMLPVPADKVDEFYKDCLRRYGLEK